MAKLSEIRNSPQKERDGVMVTYPDTDIRLKICRINNPAYEKHSRRALREHSRTHGGVRTLTERESRDLIADSIARYVLVGWVGMQDDEGKDIPYSIETARKLLLQPDLNDFYTFVLQSAGDAANYREDAVQEERGNS